MTPRARSVAGRLALLIVSVAATLAGAEILLRWFRPQPLEGAYVWPDGTLRHLPSLRFRYSRSEFSNMVTYNSLGFRGHGPEGVRSPGRVRVLFLGDSFVEGKHVADHEVLTGVLERLAAGRGLPLEVINTGVAGYGTAEEVILWDRFAHTLQPDLVLLGFYPNDVRNNIDRHLFALAGGRPVPDRPPPLPKVRLIYDIRKSFASRSHLYMLLKLARERFASPPDEAAAPMESEDVFARAPTPRIAEAWDLTIALLDLLRARVEGQGARFAVVLLPTRYQVDDALWAASAARKGLDPGAYDLRLPQKRLGAWSQESGAVLVDLLEEFRERNRDNSFYYRIDAHWNAAGHALAAEATLDGLSAAGLLDAGREPGAGQTAVSRRSPSPP